MESTVPDPTKLRWTVKVGTIAGVAIYVHATFLLLVAWLAVLDWRQTHSVIGVVEGIVFTLALFASIVLHELGHGLAARVFGIGTRDITLLPIGGVGRLERMPAEPWQELWVAVAGPMASVALAIALFAVVLVTGGPTAAPDVTLVEVPFLERLALVNVLLALFNLLPAFPMDGGRILRAVLAMRLGLTRATDIAGAIGQSLAFVLFGAGLFSSPLLVLIAVFVWLGAAEERRVAQIKAALQGVRVSTAMRTHVSTLTPDDTLKRAVTLSVGTGQHDFPVVERSTIVGMLTRDRLRRAIAAAGPSSTVEHAMQRQFETAAVDDLLEDVLARLGASGNGAIPVVASDGRLVGLLSGQGVATFLEWQRASAPPTRSSS